MKALFFILLVNVSTILMAQKTEFTTNDLCQEWVLQKGWFDQNEFVLEKKKSINRDSIVTTLTFYNNGQFNIQTHYPKNIGVCGFGRPLFSKINWILLQNALLIDVEGMDVGIDNFHYKTLYNIYLEKNVLILKKVKSLITEVKKI